MTPAEWGAVIGAIISAIFGGGAFAGHKKAKKTYDYKHIENMERIAKLEQKVHDQETLNKERYKNIDEKLDMVIDEMKHHRRRK